MRLIEIINMIGDYSDIVTIEDLENLILDFRLEDTMIAISENELRGWINKNI